MIRILLYMMLISYFAGGIKQTKPTRNIEPAEAIEMIRSGKLRIETEKYRAQSNLAIKSVMKDAMPYVTWSGTFKSRSTAGLIEHSGFICMDLDHVYHGTEEEIFQQSVELKKRISELKYCFASHRSPTDGEKVIIKINPAKHASAFMALRDLFKQVFNIEVDEKCKDVSRACFICNDQMAYINVECSTFNPADDIGNVVTVRKTTADTPLLTGDFDKLFTHAHAWAKKKGGDYGPDNHNNYAYLFACQCNRLGIPEEHTQQYALTAFTEIAEKELHASINSAYKHHPQEHGKLSKKKTHAGASSKSQSKASTDSPGTTVSDSEHRNESKEKGTIDAGEFWVEKEITKGPREGEVDIIILEDSLIHFYERNGFFRQQIISNDDKSFQVLRMLENKLEAADRPYRKEWIRKWMEEEKVDKKIHRALMRKSKTLYSNDIFEWMIGRELEFKRDTKNEAFLFFEDCFLRILPDAVEKISYSKLDAPVWKSQIIKRKYTRVDSFKKSEYFRLLCCSVIGKEDWRKTKNEMIDPENESEALNNLHSFMSAIGYLVHGYKNPSKAFTVNVFDKVMAEKKVANGRTGKTLSIELLQHVKKLVKIPGARCDLNKPETFGNVNFDTSMVLFDDCKEGFPYDKLFDIITGGMEVKRLYVDRFVIPFQYAPKIAITSNHPLHGYGDSYIGRQRNYELTNFFNAKYQPSEHFGHNLALEWDDEQWDLFYGTIIACIQTFLEAGIRQMDVAAYELNKLKRTIPESFINWCEDHIQLDFRYEKKVLYEDFKTRNTDFQELKSNSWVGWLRKWTDYHHYIINPHIVPASPSEFPRDKSGDVEYIRIVKPEEKQNAA